MADGFCRKVKQMDEEPLQGLRFECKHYADHRGWHSMNISEYCSVSWDSNDNKEKQ